MVDEENHNGQAVYASGGLKNFVDSHALSQEDYDKQFGSGKSKVKEEKAVIGLA